MAKQIDISGDGGSTFNTLPGSSGSKSNEAGSINDTIFGQTFTSTERGLINWGIEGNAYYKGYAGYEASLLRTGTATATTGEAMSQDSGQIYSVDLATRSIWDRSATYTIYDGATPVADADIDWVDFLFGRVKFADTYTVSGAVTADFSYFPTQSVGKANSYSLTQTAEAQQKTDFATAQSNGGYHEFNPGLRTVSLSLSGFYDSANSFEDLLESGEEIIIEINPDGAGNSVCRGFFKALTTGQDGDVGNIETEEVTFELSVPTDAYIPFRWNHDAATTLPQAIRDLLDSWESESTVVARYLEDGVSGIQGTCVITDISLEGALESMNEYSVSLQGSGQRTAVTP